MTPEQYAARQAVISASIARFVVQFAQFFPLQAFSPTTWLQLLQFLFPQVQQSRVESATLAREFYDFQRSTTHPELPRNDRFLEGYDFDRFSRSVEPARKLLSQEGSTGGTTRLALQVVREVENAGRQQIIHAVQEDHAPRIVRGWARVATGKETCAWCLMLISRGPTYLGADTAGLDLDDTSAVSMITAGEDVSEFMEEWHTGCDCKVVPVFKNEGWVGQEAAARALDIWNDATKVAKLSRKIQPATKRSGDDKGQQLTLNEEVINVLRGMLDSGEINPREYAGLAA